MKVIYYKEGKLNRVKTARSLAKYYTKQYIDRTVDKMQQFVVDINES